MTEKTQDWSGWDRWVEAHIRNATDRVATALGGEVGEMERRIRREVRAELEIEIGLLRAEINILRAHDHGVVDLGSWRGKKDAAA
jgi:hypothetical protein